MHHPLNGVYHQPAPAPHAHIAHSPPDRPEIRRPISIASSHVSATVLDCENIADAWRNATEQLYELEQCRDTYDGAEGSIRSGRSFAHTQSSHTGATASHSMEPTQPSVITLLEGSPGHASPFHQPVPPLHHRPSTRSSTASQSMALTTSLQPPTANLGNSTARTHHTDPHRSPRSRLQGRLESASTIASRASPQLDSNSVSLIAPAAIQYGHVARVPSLTGSGYGAHAVGTGKAPPQRSIYAPSDNGSDDSVPDDSAYGNDVHGSTRAAPAPSAVGAATATTGDEINALATYTWTGSDTDGGRSALNAAGAARRALAGGVSPAHRAESSARVGAAPGPAVGAGVQNVGGSSHFTSARVMLPQCGADGSVISSSTDRGPRHHPAMSSGMHAVSGADGRGTSLAPLPENQDTRQARHATISKLQLFSAILFFAGMNDVAELETIVQEVRRLGCTQHC